MIISCPAFDVHQLSSLSRSKETHGFVKVNRRFCSEYGQDRVLCRQRKDEREHRHRDRARTVRIVEQARVLDRATDNWNSNGDGNWNAMRDRRRGERYPLVRCCELEPADPVGSRQKLLIFPLSQTLTSTVVVLFSDSDAF